MAAQGRRTGTSKRATLLLTVLTAGLLLTGSGCNPGAMAYFLMGEAKEPALIQNLGSESLAHNKENKEKKENKVVIMTWSGLETRAEFIHADRQLADLLGKALQAQCAANEERISIVAQNKVEAFKNEKPNWRELSMPDIGRRFGADYVIYLEINEMSLYEKGSGNSLFRGRANITVSLIDVNHPDEAPEQRPFDCVFPSDARGAVPIDIDSNPVQFRQKFLSYAAKRLAWHFSRYPKREGMYVE